jgi:hypothetical protein
VTIGWPTFSGIDQGSARDGFVRRKNDPISTILAKINAGAAIKCAARASRRIGPASAEEHGKVLDRSDVALLGSSALTNLRIVMSSIMRRRNGLVASSVMEVLLS